MTDVKPTREQLAAATREFLEDCVERVSTGDSSALFDLALFWSGHMHESDPLIELGVAEGMMRFAAASGSEDAKRHLDDDWQLLKPIIERRLRQRNASKAP